MKHAIYISAICVVIFTRAGIGMQSEEREIVARVWQPRTVGPDNGWSFEDVELGLIAVSAEWQKPYDGLSYANSNGSTHLDNYVFYALKNHVFQVELWATRELERRQIPLPRGFKIYVRKPNLGLFPLEKLIQHSN